MKRDFSVAAYRLQLIANGYCVGTGDIDCRCSHSDCRKWREKKRAAAAIAAAHPQLFSDESPDGTSV